MGFHGPAVFFLFDCSQLPGLQQNDSLYTYYEQSWEKSFPKKILNLAILGQFLKFSSGD